jgi:hypothetical protein
MLSVFLFSLLLHGRGACDVFSRCKAGLLSFDMEFNRLTTSSTAELNGVGEIIATV